MDDCSPPSPVYFTVEATFKSEYKMTIFKEKKKHILYPPANLKKIEIDILHFFKVSPSYSLMLSWLFTAKLSIP